MLRLPVQGLVTDRMPFAMQCADGVIVETVEWVSREKVQSVHTNPVVQELWKKYESACWYKTPASVPELNNMFGHFEPIAALP